MKYKLLFVITFLCFIPKNTIAQNNSFSCPNFIFERNMQMGANGNDVYVLQKILNLDSRTQVSKSGVGSKGQETKIFGEKTREALKRFQALFIEYTVTANGKFNNQTRQLVNDICKGPYFTGQSSKVFSTNTSPVSANDKTGPAVTLTAPLTVFKDEIFRATINTNENIQQPEIDAIIAEGANVKDIRKISPSSYSFQITPFTDIEIKQINLQIEAEKVLDLAGNKNEQASNEILIEVLNLSSTSASTTELLGNQGSTTDESLLNSIISALPNTQTSDCSGQTVTVYDYQNPCYGRSPTVDPNNQTEQSQNSKQDLVPFLLGLLQAYGVRNAVSLLGSGVGSVLKSLGLSAENTKLVDSGGYGSIVGQCMCKGKFQGQKTIGLYKVGGVPYGRYIMTANPTATGGPFVGKVAETPGIVCGRIMDKKGNCIDPNLDSVGAQAVIGIIPASPIFKWSTPTSPTSQTNNGSISI